MDVKTKFGLGDALCVIADNGIKDFIVKAILIKEDGVEYGESFYPTYKEAKCWASRAELCDYLLGKAKCE